MFQTIDFLAKKYGWFKVEQFECEANAWIHTKTTGPEIIQAMKGLSLDYFVTATGTGGTLRGVAGYLRQHSPHTKIVVTEPDTAPIIQSDVGSTYDADGIPHESHPFFRAHLFQGWTPDAITPIVQSAKDAKLIDELISVDGHEGMATARCAPLINTAAACRCPSRPQAWCGLTTEGCGRFPRWQGTRSEGGHLYWHLWRRRSPGRAQEGAVSAAGDDAPRHRPGHGRTLPLHAPVRRHPSRYDG